MAPMGNELPRQQMGSPVGHRVWGYIVSLLKGKKQPRSPMVQERLAFEREMREQFLRLKEKGLGIPIFTL